MKKNKIKLPVATIILSVLLVVFYFAVSGGSSYITPLAKMAPLGVSGYHLIGAFTYSFMHIGIKHLLGNLISFVVFGAILEQIIDKSHVLGIFVASGVLGGIAYALLEPEVWVIGASAAVAGVLAAGVIADPKKTLLAFVLVMYFVPSVILPAADGFLDEMENQKMIAAAQAKLDLQGVEGLIEKGNYTNETLAEQIALEQQYRAIIGSRESLSEGRSTEAATPASYKIHLIGALVAIAFLYFFDRKIVKKFWGNMIDTIKS